MAHVPRFRDAERAAAAVAARQHGRISTRQLAAAGWSPDVIAARVSSGWLVREHRGTYRLAGAPPDLPGRGAAAVLTVGGDAALTHRSGLKHHEVLAPQPGLPVHVTTARHRRPRPGIVVHQAPLPVTDVVRVGGLRVTTLTRCLVDAARIEPAAVVERAVREAEFLRKLDAGALHAAAAGHSGSALLRRIAAERLPIRGELREAFERGFATFLMARGFPPADVNRQLWLAEPRQRVVLDVVWWEAGLAVELDSRKAHLLPSAFEADRERDRRLAAQHAISVVRVTWRQLHDRPDALAADLFTLLARGGAAGTAHVTRR